MPRGGRTATNLKKPIRIGCETVTPQQLAVLAGSMMSQAEVGEIFGVTQQAISALLQKPAFREAWDQARARTKQKLRQKQIDAALEGDKTMLIWTGKQYLDQRDSVKEIEQKSTTQITYIAKWGGRYGEIEAPAPGEAELIEGEVEDEEEE